MALVDNRSDYELVLAYQRGEQKVFATLLERHKEKVYTYIQSLVKDKAVADDIFQDTFIKVINTLRSGTYHEEGKFCQWVMRIARNLIVDNARKNQKVTLIHEKPDYDIFDIKGDYFLNKEDEMIKKQVYKDLRFLVNQLPKEQRRVLIMRHYADMSFKEIADQTGVSINTALGRMRYAIVNIRKIAEQYSISLTK